MGRYQAFEATPVHPVLTRAWWWAAIVRALRTMAQTVIALIGTEFAGITSVAWTAIISAAALAGVVSILTSLAGLPEVTEWEAE